MQTLDPRGPFYLSQRKAGQLLGISHVSAGKLLEMLQADQIIAIAEAPTNIRATRYKFVAIPAEPASPPETRPGSTPAAALDEQAEIAAIIEGERSFSKWGDKIEWDYSPAGDANRRYGQDVPMLTFEQGERTP